MKIIAFFKRLFGKKRSHHSAFSGKTCERRIKFEGRDFYEWFMGRGSCGREELQWFSNARNSYEATEAIGFNEDGRLCARESLTNSSQN